VAGEVIREGTMSRVLQRLNVLATCLLGGVLGAVLVVQIWPQVRALAQGPMSAQAAKEEAEFTWPKTLQVTPAHAGDPVELVRIAKGGEELVPGKYKLPQIAGNNFDNVKAVEEWVRDVSFTLKSHASKGVVSLGMAVILPVRDTDFDCLTVGGTSQKWCDAHAHYCDGGCPVIRYCTLHWGMVPDASRTGLESRFKAEAELNYGNRDWRELLQGTKTLFLAPGADVTLSADGRTAGMVFGIDPRGSHFPSPMNGILGEEGLEEARNAEPCETRANSKTGCAFAEVAKFNIGIDVVYFEDGTIWGNYGYGYATPNADGIFTRVNVHGSPETANPAYSPN
jgi:hypothetical protein